MPRFECFMHEEGKPQAAHYVIQGHSCTIKFDPITVGKTHSIIADTDCEAILRYLVELEDWKQREGCWDQPLRDLIARVKTVSQLGE